MSARTAEHWKRGRPPSPPSTSSRKPPPLQGCCLPSSLRIRSIRRKQVKQGISWAQARSPFPKLAGQVSFPDDKATVHLGFACLPNLQRPRSEDVRKIQFQLGKLQPASLLPEWSSYFLTTQRCAGPNTGLAWKPAEKGLGWGWGGCLLRNIFRTSRKKERTTRNAEAAEDADKSRGLIVLV